MTLPDKWLPAQLQKKNRPKPGEPMPVNTMIMEAVQDLNDVESIIEELHEIHSKSLDLTAMGLVRRLKDRLIGMAE